MAKTYRDVAIDQMIAIVEEAMSSAAQAIKIGNTIHVSGQLSQDDKGAMIAPAALDESGKPADSLVRRVTHGVAGFAGLRKM